MTQQLQSIIDTAWDNRASLSPDNLQYSTSSKIMDLLDLTKTSTVN